MCPPEHTEVLTNIVELNDFFRATSECRNKRGKFDSKVFELWETLMVKGELGAALAEADTDYKRAVTHYALGNTAKADEALAGFIENTHGYTLALVYGYRGDVDKTFEWLDYMLENSDYFPTFILSEMAFQSVHSDPRWKRFLEKLGLFKYWHEMTPG